MELQHWRATMVTALAFGLIATPAVAQQNEQESQDDMQAQEMAQETETPYTAMDDTWISLSGTVESVSPDAFVLDYGNGIATIEMDDWDADADAYKVVEGDEVTVTGLVDDDLFEMAKVEASSVYVENLNSYFYASATDEEDTFVATVPVAISDITVQGTVTAVSGDEFTVDSGIREIIVDVENMTNHPLDDEGFLQIEVGDYVSVSGESDTDFFEGRELMAESITSLEWED